MMNEKKKSKSFIVVLGFLILLFIFAVVRTMWGVTYLFKYLTYDNHSWGEIIYISDYLLPNRPYPENINIQMSLDEPVNGNYRYSITFSRCRRYYYKMGYNYFIRISRSFFNLFISWDHNFYQN